MQARAEVIESVGVVSSMVDNSIAIRITGCTICAINAGEAAGLTGETSLC